MASLRAGAPNRNRRVSAYARTPRTPESDEVEQTQSGQPKRSLGLERATKHDVDIAAVGPRDEGGATEFFNRGDALIWQARSVMEGAGFAADRIENAVMTSALTTGFRYGAGEAEDMLAECLAAEDSP